MKKRKLKLITIVSFWSAVALACGIVPLTSYLSYLRNLSANTVTDNSSKVVSLSFGKDFAGKLSVDEDFTVYAVMGSGTLKKLKESQYTVEVRNRFSSSEIGVGYHDVLLSAPDLFADTVTFENVAFYDQLEGEDADITGGTAKEETVDGVTYHFAGGFNTGKIAQTDQEDPSFEEKDGAEFTFYTADSSPLSLIADLSNGYYTEGISNGISYNYMKSVKMTDLVDILVDGEMITPTEENVLPSSYSFSESTVAGFNHYFERKLTSLEGLESGKHRVKLQMKQVEGVTNCWNEYLTTNIDWIRLEPQQENDYSDIVSLSLDDIPSPEYGRRKEGYELSGVRGVKADGTSFSMDENDLSFRFDGSDEFFAGKDYTVSVALKGTDLTAEKTFSVSPDPYVMEAESDDVERENEDLRTEGSITYDSIKTNGDYSSFYFTFDTFGGTVWKLSMSAANGYLCYTDDSHAKWKMNALQLNSVLDIALDGNNLAIDDSVCLPETDEASEGDYSLYFLFTSTDLLTFRDLADGRHSLKITSKSSSLGQKNVWNESPNFNLDSFTLLPL